jgi:hypothetical protein
MPFSHYHMPSKNQSWRGLHPFSFQMKFMDGFMRHHNTLYDMMTRHKSELIMSNYFLGYPLNSICPYFLNILKLTLSKQMFTSIFQPFTVLDKCSHFVFLLILLILELRLTFIIHSFFPMGKCAFHISVRHICMIIWAQNIFIRNILANCVLHHE